MVNFAKLSVGTAILAAQLAFGAPQVMKRTGGDSSLGDEVAVSAPDGIPITNSKELASQKSAEAAGGYQTDNQNTNAWETSSSDNAYQTNAWETSSSDNAYQSNAWETSSSDNAYQTNAYESSSSDNAYETAAPETSNAENAYQTQNSWENTATYESPNAENTASATYGSGSANWGNNGYNDCVQQCIASFGAPAATYTPPSASESAGGEGGGNGVTHTVIVAPSQGVLRYIPFATNASVGDTIKFVWNANVHTVTKSSQLEICNKTTTDAFASGTQNKSFVFTQVVNSTDPTFFYCAVPTHCQKGMFGIVNAPNADVASSNSSVAAMMPQLVSNSSNVAAWNSYTQKTTAGSKAATWGNSIDMANVPGWAMEVFAENVMYTRNFLAMNPDVMKDDGSIDLGASSAPFMIPQDLSSVLAAGGSSASATPSVSGNASPAANSDTAASASPSASGARGVTASFGLASIVALGAALVAF